MDRQISVPRPVARDALLDLVRASALLVVVLWHWIFTSVRWSHDGPHVGNPVAVTPGMWLLTWLLQIMPASTASAVGLRLAPGCLRALLGDRGQARPGGRLDHRRAMVAAASRMADRTAGACDPALQAHPSLRRLARSASSSPFSWMKTSVPTTSSSSSARPSMTRDPPL